MKTCLTCKWWGHPETKNITDHRFCQKLSDESLEKISNGALALNSVDGVGVLQTGPDFGCILHEDDK